jgi:hypothetical protein
VTALSDGRSIVVNYPLRSVDGDEPRDYFDLASHQRQLG